MPDNDQDPSTAIRYSVRGKFYLIVVFTDGHSEFIPNVLVPGYEIDLFDGDLSTTGNPNPLNLPAEVLAAMQTQDPLELLAGLAAIQTQNTIGSTSEQTTIQTPDPLDSTSDFWGAATEFFLDAQHGGDVLNSQ